MTKFLATGRKNAALGSKRAGQSPGRDVWLRFFASSPFAVDLLLEVTGGHRE
jgi:hypothetical protein